MPKTFLFFQIITNVMLQILPDNLMSTKHYLLPGSVLTNPYEPTPKVAIALELRVPETSRLFDRLLPVKHKHVPTDSLLLSRPVTYVRSFICAISHVIKVVLDTACTLNHFTYCWYCVYIAALIIFLCMHKTQWDNNGSLSQLITI